MVTKSKQSITKRSSLEAVAALSGVSTATVSRVLNQSARVSEKKRIAVQKACDEIGYVINGRARALSLDKTWTMGAVVPTLAIETFSRLLNAFQTTLHSDKYTLLLANTNFNEEVELKEVANLISHGIDGLMLVGDKHSPKLWKLIESNQIPCIQVLTNSTQHPSIGINNTQVAYDITTHLLAQGHEDLGILVGMPTNNDRVMDRMKGIEKRLSESGLSLHRHHVHTDVFTFEESINTAKKLLCLKRRPTALICGNDMLAFGAILAAQELKLKVPADVSVIGFNNYEMSAYLSPPLSTVDVDLDSIGESAAQYLIERNLGVEYPQLPTIHTQILIRESTGQAPAK